MDAMTLRRLAALVLVGSLTSCTLGQARTAYVLGAAADMTTTEMALHEGLHEANPLYRQVEHPAIISGAVTLGSIAFAEWAVERNPANAKAATWFYRCLAAARITAATVNAVRLIQHRKDEKKNNGGAYVALRVTW